MGYPIEIGSIQCDAPGQNASYDSIVSCVLFQIPFKLELIGFGYICLALLIPIIFISIFGKIKEQYRWFILNQALWDLLITYDFICEKPTWYGYFQRQIGPETMFYEPASCFYGNTGDSNIFFASIKDAIKYISYFPLFLLTFSRFICLYNHRFYELHSTTPKLIIIIIISNIFFLFVLTFPRTHAILIDEAKINLEYNDGWRNCHFDNCPVNMTTYIPDCSQPLIDECVSKLTVYDPRWKSAFEILKTSLIILFLFLSIILSILMVVKVSQQLKFQLQHNRSSLQTTLRISAVCLFQCFTMTFMLLLILFSSINDLRNRIPMLEIPYTFFENLPSWAYLLQMDFTVQSFNNIRVFLDSTIILSVLNGYRRNCKLLVIFIFKLITNPKNAFYSYNLTSSTTITVSTITNNPTTTKILKLN